MKVFAKFPQTTTRVDTLQPTIKAHVRVQPNFNNIISKTRKKMPEGLRMKGMRYGGSDGTGSNDDSIENE